LTALNCTDCRLIARLFSFTVEPAVQHQSLSWHLIVCLVDLNC